MDVYLLRHDMVGEMAGDADQFTPAYAGCQTAFIARPGMVLGPLSEQPEYVGSDLAEVADLVIEQNHSSS